MQSIKSWTFPASVALRHWSPHPSNEGKFPLSVAIGGVNLGGANERRFGNLAGGLGDGRCGSCSDCVVAERSVNTKLAHAWVGLAFDVQFFAELA